MNRHAISNESLTSTMQEFRSSRQLPPLSFPSPYLSSPQLYPNSISKPKPNSPFHTQQQQQQPSSFPLFPLLPPELRLKIFTHALPPPQLHTISLPTCSCTLPSSLCHRQHAPRTLSPLPVLLRVNSEARNECLRRYTIISSPLGRGFHLAFDAERDSVFFCGGYGFGVGGVGYVEGEGEGEGEGRGRFWEAEGRWPGCVDFDRGFGLGVGLRGEVEGEGESERERTEIRHLVLDEAMLERKDYLQFPERILNMESVTILLMPWASRPGSGGTLIPRFNPDEQNHAGEEEEEEEEKEWGLKRLRSQFLTWMEEMRVELGLERKPVLKVAQWGACLGSDGGEEGPWRLVEKGFWFHWEYNGRER